MKPSTLGGMAAAWICLTLATAGTGVAIVEQHAAAEREQIEAERVQPGYVACTSLYHLDRFNQAKHRQQIEMMMEDECLPTERLAEFPFVVLNEGTVEVNKVRLFLPDDQYADLFVPADAIKNRGAL